jgi:hypothetical protein
MAAEFDGETQAGWLTVVRIVSAVTNIVRAEVRR